MKKTRITVLLITISMWVPASANIILPDDTPTIEALIDNHKLMSKEEAQSAIELGLYTPEQQLTKDYITKFKEAKTTLYSKLKVANSWLMLGQVVVQTGLDVKKLIEESTEFTKFAAKNIEAKPWVAWYYISAANKVSREIKKVSLISAQLGLESFNLMRASMEQRFRIVYFLKDTIDRCISIIKSAKWFSVVYVNGYYRPCYFKDILNSEMKESVCRNIEKVWLKNATKF